MPPVSREDLDEIFESLFRLDGAIRALKVVVLHHIAACDDAHRDHAERLIEMLDAVSGIIPEIPPYQAERDQLDWLKGEIAKIAARHR